MSEHRANILWQRNTEDFLYDTYQRNHEWRFEGGTSIEASSAVAYLGDAEKVDPEEAFVASVASCHMLTFLALCARKRIVVNHYDDKAVGYLEKNATGKLAITRVELTPQIQFEDTPPDREALQKLHDRSHTECFIANSIISEVSVNYPE